MLRLTSGYKFKFNSFDGKIRYNKWIENCLIFLIVSNGQTLRFIDAATNKRLKIFKCYSFSGVG